MLLAGKVIVVDVVVPEDELEEEEEMRRDPQMANERKISYKQRTKGLTLQLFLTHERREHLDCVLCDIKPHTTT